MARSGGPTNLLQLHHHHLSNPPLAPPGYQRIQHARDCLRANIQDRSSGQQPHSAQRLPRVRVSMPLQPATEGQGERALVMYRQTSQLSSSKVPTTSQSHKIVARIRKEKSTLSKDGYTSNKNPSNKDSGHVNERTRPSRAPVEDETSTGGTLERGGCEGRLDYAHMPVTLSQLHSIMTGTDKRFRNYTNDTRDTDNTDKDKKKTNIRISIQRENQGAMPAVKLTMKVTLPHIKPPTTPSTTLIIKQRKRRTAPLYKRRTAVPEEGTSVTYPEDCDVRSAETSNLLRHLDSARVGSVEKTRRWLVDNPVELAQHDPPITPHQATPRNSALPPVAEGDTKSRPVIKIKFKSRAESNDRQVIRAPPDSGKLLTRRPQNVRQMSHHVATSGPKTGTSKTLTSIKETEL